MNKKSISPDHDHVSGHLSLFLRSDYSNWGYFLPFASKNLEFLSVGILPRHPKQVHWTDESHMKISLFHNWMWACAA
jgi:hypothetical protein